MSAPIATSTDSHIEFFISKDSSEIGVSVSGLARLCGVSVTTLRGVLAAISGRDLPVGTPVHPILQPLLGTDPYISPALTGNNPVVRSAVCTKLIEYHAQRDKNPLTEAKQSLDRFSQIGFENWVRSTINPYEGVHDADRVIHTLIRDIQDLKQQMADTRGYQKVYTAIPGLRHWMESIAEGRFDRAVGEQQQMSLLPAEAQSMTIREWLEYYLKGQTIPKGKKHTLANMVASAFTAMFETEPDMVVRRNDRGYKLPAVKAYPVEAFGIIENCWKAIESDG